MAQDMSAPFADYLAGRTAKYRNVIVVPMGIVSYGVPLLIRTQKQDRHTNGKDFWLLDGITLDSVVREDTTGKYRYNTIEHLGDLRDAMFRCKQPDFDVTGDVRAFDGLDYMRWVETVPEDE